MKRQTADDGRPMTNPARRDLPDGWKWARLADVCTKPQYGYTAKARQEPVGPKMLRITDIQDGNVDWDGVPFCQCSTDEYEKYALEVGDILFARTGSVGKSFLITELAHQAIFASYLIRVRALQSIDSQFLYAFLQSSDYWMQIEVHTHGAVQPNVNATQLATLHIPLPPLPEQRAIAHALRTVQQARAARQRELTLERERKAALMEHLFTHGTRGEPRKQTEIGAMPESWRVSKLGNLANLITKGASPTWQGFDYREEGVTFVRSQNIGWGRLKLDELVYLPEAFNRKEKKSIIKGNDLLINLVGASIGRAAVATKEIEGGNLNQAIAIVRLNEDYSPHFGMYFILTESGQVQLHKFEKDIARANVSLDDINNYLVPFANMEQQQSIVRILGTCDAKIATLEREMQVLDELFRAVLDELMTGGLRATSLIDVGGSV